MGVLNCMRLFYSGDQGWLWLFISDEPAQALSPRQNFEILVTAYKSLLINGRWKEREGGNAYESFGGKILLHVLLMTKPLIFSAP